jgi:hypothetical protein
LKRRNDEDEDEDEEYDSGRQNRSGGRREAGERVGLVERRFRHHPAAVPQREGEAVQLLLLPGYLQRAQMSQSTYACLPGAVSKRRTATTRAPLRCGRNQSVRIV